jgi:hypothetical protein
MPGSWNPGEFPSLNEGNHIITSPFDRLYNCTAWAAGITTRKWWPDRRNIGFWPKGVPRQETVGAFFQAYGTLGYKPCFSCELEYGVEKIAIYAIRDADGTETPTHAAIQLTNGRWSSKLGDFEDISHVKPEDVTGPLYGHKIYYLSRSRPL